jgi:hypothetical protein
LRLTSAPLTNISFLKRHLDRFSSRSSDAPDMASDFDIFQKPFNTTKRKKRATQQPRYGEPRSFFVLEGCWTCPSSALQIIFPFFSTLRPLATSHHSCLYPPQQRRYTSTIFFVVDANSRVVISPSPHSPLLPLPSLSPFPFFFPSISCILLFCC